MIDVDRKNSIISYLGKTVKVKIDRPIGYIHKGADWSITYPVNYGYIPEVIGRDDEEQDVYVLGVDKPIDEFTGEVIAVICREDDIEDKLVAVSNGMILHKAQIKEAVWFQEKYFKSKYYCLYEKSCETDREEV